MSLMYSTCLRIALGTVQEEASPYFFSTEPYTSRSKLWMANGRLITTCTALNRYLYVELVFLQPSLCRTYSTTSSSIIPPILFLMHKGIIAQRTKTSKRFQQKLKKIQYFIKFDIFTKLSTKFFTKCCFIRNSRLNSLQKCCTRTKWKVYMDEQMKRGQAKRMD